jgi:hypothetical protein
MWQSLRELAGRVADGAAIQLQTAREMAGRIADEVMKGRRSVLAEMTSPSPLPAPGASSLQTPDISPFSQFGAHISSYFFPKLTFIFSIHAWLISTRPILWSYSILPPVSLTGLPVCMLPIRLLCELFDRTGLVMLVVFFIFGYILYKLYCIIKAEVRRQYDRIVNHEIVRKDLTDLAHQIQFVTALEDYDDDLFEIQKEPENNPSVLSPMYSDYQAPVKLSHDEAKRYVDTVYPIPASYQNWLGAGDFILEHSWYHSSVDEGTPPTKLMLFSPADLGLNRNTSPRSVFNLVITGQLEMTCSPSVNSPCSVTLKNPSDQPKPYSLPKGTVFCGERGQSPPIKTTASIWGILGAFATIVLSIPWIPMEIGFCWMWRLIWPVGYNGGWWTWVWTPISVPAGSYRLTPFIQAAKQVRARPFLTPPQQLADPTWQPGGAKCDLEGCDILKERLANVKVRSMQPCRRSLEGTNYIDKHHLLRVKDAYHESFLTEFEDGTHVLLEKMREGKHCVIRGHVVEPPPRDLDQLGFIDNTNKRHWRDPNNEAMAPNDNDRLITVTGNDLYRAVEENSGSYRLVWRDCRHFASNLCDKFGIQGRSVNKYAIIRTFSVVFGAFIDFGQQSALSVAGSGPVKSVNAAIDKAAHATGKAWDGVIDVGVATVNSVVSAGKWTWTAVTKAAGLAWRILPPWH